MIFQANTAVCNSLHHFEPQPIHAKKIKDRVVKEKIINFDIFLKYCKLNQQDTKEMENILHNNGYNFSNEKLLITKDDEIFMQKEIDEVFIPWVDEFVR